MNDSRQTKLYEIREGLEGLIWVIARTPIDAATLAHRAGFLLYDEFEVVAIGDEDAAKVKMLDDYGPALNLTEEFASDDGRRVVAWNEP